MFLSFKTPTVAGMAIAVIVGLPAAAPVADPILEWNAVTLDAIREMRLPPPRATRLLATVHLAAYDAVNGIDGGFEPYYVMRPAVPGSSSPAAAAVAAHDVLAGMLPELSRTFDVALAVSLGDLPSGPAVQKGAAWGRFVAGQFLRLRRDDGADATVAYEPSGEFGRWEPTPPSFAPALLPQWPYVRPFAMPTGSAFRPGPPPELTSPAYAESFQDVKDLGATDSWLRTDDQTQVAFFWEDGPGSATPPGHWQIIARELAESAGMTLADNARLFALLSLTQADAAIAAWDSKYYFDHLRPYTGITRADEDGNDLTEADPLWTPLLPTPPFPSYTSGHSVFSGSSAEILALWFGDVPFSSAAPDPDLWPDVLYDESGNPVVRSWPSLSDAAAEAGFSRICGGIHWGYDNVEGLQIGRDLAHFVFYGLLRPRTLPMP